MLSPSRRFIVYIRIILFSSGMVVRSALAGDIHEVVGRSYYQGCAPSSAGDDRHAYQVALMRAMGDQSRDVSLLVSGAEVYVHPGSDELYGREIVEASSSFLASVRVVRTSLELIDGVSHLCVWISTQEEGAR